MNKLNIQYMTNKHDGLFKKENPINDEYMNKPTDEKK